MRRPAARLPPQSRADCGCAEGKAATYEGGAASGGEKQSGRCDRSVSRSVIGMVFNIGPRHAVV